MQTVEEQVFKDLIAKHQVKLSFAIPGYVKSYDNVQFLPGISNFYRDTVHDDMYLVYWLQGEFKRKITKLSKQMWLFYWERYKQMLQTVKEDAKPWRQYASFCASCSLAPNDYWSKMNKTIKFILHDKRVEG